jgi:polysaccharide deacetylase 2 family uncharacterized protein YibQ
MAEQSKKNSTGTPSRRKRRSSSKRRAKKQSTFKTSLFIVLGVFLMISMVAFGYFLGQSDLLNSHTPIEQTYKTHAQETKKKIVEDISKSKTQKSEEKKEPAVKKEVSKETLTPGTFEYDEMMEEALSKKEKEYKITLAGRGEKPKLVIIIDDVSTRSQMNLIQSTGLKITPSIFPPSQRSKTSHTLAKGLDHYMIHLPMESGSAQFNTQSKTLLTTFSQEQIEERVKEIRKLFPSARYINNHTGSVYTDNYEAMKRLYSALRTEGFVFVDSRTIASTKVPQITNEFGDAYVARDVFIDNEHNIPYIHRQLQKAVDKAKKEGHAIAIGHPHKITLKALSSADDLFKDVELVYIDALYKQ